MSSQPMLELLNSLHLFVGNQVVLVGEFLQLRPILNIVLTRVISCSSFPYFALHHRVNRNNAADTNRPKLFVLFV